MEDNQQRRIFGSAVAGVLRVHIFRVTEEGQTVFQRDCFQVRVHIAPYHHQNLVSLDPFSFVNLGKVLQYLFVVCLFFFISLLLKWLRMFSCFLAIWISFYVMCHLKTCPNFYWLSVFFLMIHRNHLDILDYIYTGYQYFANYMCCKYVLPGGSLYSDSLNR